MPFMNAPKKPMPLWRQVKRRVMPISFLRKEFYKIMKLIKTSLFAVLVAAAVSGCNQKSNTDQNAASPAEHQLTIGIAYQNLQNEFIINIQDAARAEAKKQNVNFLEADGEGNADKQ